MTIKHIALSALTGTLALTASADVDWRDGCVTLVRPDKNSAAFFIEFEL